MAADTTTTTADPLSGVPLYLRRDGEGYMITDVVGLRYGWAMSIAEALEMWAACVEDCLTDVREGKAGGPYLVECERYREALL